MRIKKVEDSDPCIQFIISGRCEPVDVLVSDRKALKQLRRMIKAHLKDTKNNDA